MGFRSYGAAPVSSAITALLSSAVQVLGRNTTVVTSAGETTERTLTSFSVPAGVMGSTRKLRLEVDLEYLNNSGGPLVNGHVFRLVLGGVDLWKDTGKAISSSANVKPCSMVWLVHNAGAAVQVVGGRGILGGAPATTGIGEGADDEVDMNTAWGSRIGTVDTTQAQTLALLWAHGDVHANISIRHNSSTLELV